MVGVVSTLRRGLLAGGVGMTCGMGLGLGPGLGDAIACQARVELAAREAFVGEQVLHEIVFLDVARDARIEWLAPPDFPDMRVASLPPPLPGTRNDRFERRERRALWPARPGEITLPAARFRCTPASSGTGGADDADRSGRLAGGASSGVYATPTATLRVLPVPTAGRPASWRGLVGEVSVTLQTSATQVRVGEPIELRAVAIGRGHMQRARIDWPRSELETQAPEPELFERPAQLFEQPGGQMVGRRTALLDVVPRAPGRLRVPPVSVAWFDPRTRSFESARSAALEIEVMATPSARSSGDPSGAAPASRLQRGGRWRIVLGTGVAAAIVACVIAAVRRAAAG